MKLNEGLKLNEIQNIRHSIKTKIIKYKNIESTILYTIWNKNIIYKNLNKKKKSFHSEVESQKQSLKKKKKGKKPSPQTAAHKVS